MSAEEEAVVRAFFLPNRRERYIGLLAAGGEQRKKFTDSLAHSRDLDPRWKREIEPNRQHSPDIAILLRAMGAPAQCRIISEWTKFDGREMDLREALAEIVGYGMGTILSCVPGKLAYYEGESLRVKYILQRP